MKPDYDHDKIIPSNGQDDRSSHFIKVIIDQELKANKNKGIIRTRFPPEPNGYLHIGHAKSICLNFGLAKEYHGLCNLRFDDTNPSKEDQEYVDSIKQDVRWLGFDWEDRLYYASDYFEQLYQYALVLIRAGKAYVCTLSPEQIREFRGTLTASGKQSPCRNQSVEENLVLFEKMKNGEFNEGECVLRAKIDMASPNLNMRDPVIYRILNVEHHRTGVCWCIYPMYDYTHCISDSIESITHSICTLEFEDHRPLYDWFLDQLGVSVHPRQIEFARLNLNFTVMSKRKLLELVEKKVVSGWDDPRMPTIAGMRRRGYPAEAIRAFCDIIGVAKKDSVVDIALLDFSVREVLNKTAHRVMAVLRPLKVVIDNYPLDQIEELDAVNNPEDLAMGTRKILFSKVIYIEQDDFREDPPKKYFRLFPGNEVRLKHAYLIRCQSVVKDPESGRIVELHCTYDPESRGGEPKDGRSVRGTLHWVSAKHAINAEIRLYNHLFTQADPEEEGDFKQNLNPESVVILKDCKLEASLGHAVNDQPYQFMRIGYFYRDPGESAEGWPVFNRTVGLKDSWSKIEKKLNQN